VSAPAWLLDFGGGCRAAVGLRQQLHLIHSPEVAEVPATPAHCAQVLFFAERCVPVFDIALWLGVDPSARNRRYLGVYAFRGERGEAPGCGALWLRAAPRRISVDDAQARALPEHNASRWALISHACFADDAGAVPVLDLHRMFSAALPD
jgi:chemotaxis signal transduction protein